MFIILYNYEWLFGLILFVFYSRWWNTGNSHSIILLNLLAQSRDSQWPLFYTSSLCSVTLWSSLISTVVCSVFGASWFRALIREWFQWGRLFLLSALAWYLRTRWHTRDIREMTVSMSLYFNEMLPNDKMALSIILEFSCQWKRVNNLHLIEETWNYDK